MKSQVAAVWDTKPGKYHTGRTKEQQKSLLNNGWSLVGAKRYIKAMEYSIGRGLRNRIKEAIN